MVNTLERTLVKVSHIVKTTCRRNIWIKILISIVIVLLLYKKMVEHTSINSVYQYYRISDRDNKGLTANDPHNFMLNDRNITITSGTIHYFRVHPNYWRDRLQKLRAMGAVAVETYAPWNLHEPYKDVYDFGHGGFEMSPFLDVVKFIKLAKEEDLLVIFRPGPYICAEWDFGGLPSYLLGDGAKVRTSDLKYMVRVEKYFSKLLSLVAPLQVTYGGPIIMVQIENEYGSLRNPEHQHMVQLKKIIEDQGIKSLLFTADSPDPSLDTGALPDLGVLQTANFQKDGQQQLKVLRQLQPSKPMMAMEFWTGWFDHWDQPVHNVFSPQDYLDKISEILSMSASVNLYMFHGGTTFGFLNGANNDDTEVSYHPDTSSYDYDALVTEAGDYTVKYSATLELFRASNPWLAHPSPPALALRTLSLNIQPEQELPWAAIVKQLPQPKGVLKNSKDFIYMEDLPADEKGHKQNFGYVRYARGMRVTEPRPKLKLTGRVRDIAIVMVDGRRQTIPLSEGSQSDEFGFWASQEEELELDVNPGMHTVELFVENCGRINYVKTLEWIMQKKGLGPENQLTVTGAEFTTDFDITGMPFLSTWVSSLTGWQDRVVVGSKDAPSFVKSSFTLTQDQISDTFLDIHGWRKGVVYVNGFNIGRYFSGGPQLTMFIPAPLLKVGKNIIVIFEHYMNAPTVQLVTEPSYL